MSLNEKFPSQIPALTQQIVDPILPANSVCRLLGDEGANLVNEDKLSQMYHIEGRGGINPVILSFVLIMQFSEKIPDRQATKMCVMRMDWKYALRQELTWEGFDYSSLCNFRKRLYAHGQEFVIFEQLIVYLREKGYLKSKKQRTDATHVLGAIEHLSRLELVWETLRLALKGLINADARWVLDKLPELFVEEYIEKKEDYRLSKSKVEAKMASAGRDGFWLLAHLKTHRREDLLQLPELVLLERVLNEQFTPPTDGQPAKAKTNQTACGDVIASPHDTDVRYSQKGKNTTWEGYKAQVTETTDTPFRVITDIAIHAAIEADNKALGAIQQRLIKRGLKPDKQYVDRGYSNGITIASSAQEDIDLRGYVQMDSRKNKGFRLEDFEIDTEKRQATCPYGRKAVHFNPSTQLDVAFHVRFGKQCQSCPVQSQCTSETRGRALEIRVNHEIIQQRRREQKTATFQKEMNERSLIESTIYELARVHRLRQLRYRGEQKANLQAAFTAVAVNLERLARHQAEKAPHTSIDMGSDICQAA